VNKLAGDNQPRGHWANNQTLYSRKLGGPVLTVGAGGEAARYLFEHDKGKWKKLGPTPEPLRWNEFYADYVEPWGCYLVSGKKGWLKYWPATGKAEPIDSPKELTRCQTVSYDHAGRVVITLQPIKVSKYRRDVVPWALDIETMKWTKLDPPKPWPRGQTVGAWGSLWYDPHHNVHLLINDVRRDRQATFDGGVTETWAYRYKHADKTGADKTEAKEQTP
jgi:hypothetical protein